VASLESASVRRSSEAASTDGGATTQISRSALPARPASAPVLGIDIGVGVFTRSLSFTSSENLAQALRPNAYSGGAAPSLLATGEIYPFALGDKSSVWAGLGFAASFEKAFMIKANLANAEHTGEQTALGGGVRWRFRFTDEPTTPSFDLIAGLNRQSFTIDGGASAVGIPDVTYTYVDMGAAGRIPLSSRFAVRVEARYLHVLDAGQIAMTSFYGGAAVLGFSADVGAELAFGGGGFVRAGVRFQRFLFDFDGTGTFSSNRDGDPATQDVSAASDLYLGAYLRTGWMF